MGNMHRVNGGIKNGLEMSIVRYQFVYTSGRDGVLRILGKGLDAIRDSASCFFLACCSLAVYRSFLRFVVFICLYKDSPDPDFGLQIDHPVRTDVAF